MLSVYFMGFAVPFILFSSTAADANINYVICCLNVPHISTEMDVRVFSGLMKEHILFLAVQMGKNDVCLLATALVPSVLFELCEHY